MPLTIAIVSGIETWTDTYLFLGYLALHLVASIFGRDFHNFPVQ